MAVVATVAFQGNDSVRPIKVLALTKYGRIGASSRLRFLQYLPWLEQRGVQATVQALLSDEMLQTRYQRGTYGLLPLIKAYVSRWRALLSRRQFDVLWIEKEALPWMPLWLEHLLLRGVPYVLDFDDAVFHTYDQHRHAWVRRLYGQRLDGLMAQATLVVGGNKYLARRAQDAGARWVEVLPTVIDLNRYPAPVHANDLTNPHGVPCIVWIGSPTTTHYLKMLQEPFQDLARSQPFVLRVVGGEAVDLPGVQVEVVPWSETSEVASISACDVGIMPLLDSHWERGKCGYKLIQYMACGLPVVASPVGVNGEIVLGGKNGFLADAGSEWVETLGKLLSDAALRQQMGRAGRQRVEAEYCIQKTAPRLVGWLRKAGGGR